MAVSALRGDQQPVATVQQTLQSLDSAAADTSLASLSGLGIPQVRALKREIAEIFPASNLPGFLLQGLLQLKGRALDGERVDGDLRVLFRETRQIGLYGTFLAAPALILYGYQRLLTLAGKDIESAFPDGTWQFYTEFGLREDAARHCVETHGFASAGAILADADAAACWVAAAAQALFCYDDLLANEWHERVAMRCVDLALAEQAAANLGRRLPRKADERERALATEVAQLRAEYKLGQLAGEWSARRPFAGPADDPLDGYAPARRRAFDSFLERRLRAAPRALRELSQSLYAERRASEMPAFQAQMSLLQTLHADNYGDRRAPLPFVGLCVAFICGGCYHLIELCERDEQGHLLITPRDGDPTRPGQSLPLREIGPGEWVDRYGQAVRADRRGELRVEGMRVGRLRRAPLGQLRAQVAAVVRANRPRRAGQPAAAPPTDMLLASAPRGRQDSLRGLLGAATRASLAELRRAPIVVNWDQHDAGQPLGRIRQSQRGCGDHALSILRADGGAIFDMSHIFFDGIWGAVLAEIVTGFASALAQDVPTATLRRTATPSALSLVASQAFLGATRDAAAQAPAEVCAETRTASLPTINSLRRRLAEREMSLTVNDILLLARYEHAASYQPGPAAMAGLNDLAGRGDASAQLHTQIVGRLEGQRALVPSLLIPMDASGLDPRQRLHPATLRNPQPELLPRLARCDSLIRAMAKAPDLQKLRVFEAERTELCGELLRYAALMHALREITTRGESFTTAALKLLGHLPRPMQSLMDLIPQKIDLLNEIVKGGEVFSNIGQVPRGSSVARFASSRDDGDTKLLIWGIMADATGQLVITLRDFRPHVAPLLGAGHTALAELLAADFLESYAISVNNLAKRVQRVLAYK